MNKYVKLVLQMIDKEEQKEEVLELMRRALYESGGFDSYYGAGVKLYKYHAHKEYWRLAMEVFLPRLIKIRQRIFLHSKQLNTLMETDPQAAWRGIRAAEQLYSWTPEFTSLRSYWEMQEFLAEEADNV